MFSSLVCGTVVFPGLFYTSRKVLKYTFPHWSEADEVSVSERSAEPTRTVKCTELLQEMRQFNLVLLIHQLVHVVYLLFLLICKELEKLAIILC